MSSSKKAIFYLLLVLIVWIMVEVLTFAYISIIDDERFSWSRYESLRNTVIQDYAAELNKEQALHKKSLKSTEGIRRGYRAEVIHPYLGYVNEFRDYLCPGYGFCDERGRQHGSDISTKTENQIIIGIFGGSFAGGVANTSTPGYWEQQLGTLPQFNNKEIIIHNFATGGYKQPQQLMALNYFLLLGIQFDYVINIDGFNEIVLPIVDGIAFGTHPIFPRAWARRLRGSYNKEMLVMIGTVEYNKRRRFRHARGLNQSNWRFSPAVNLVWKASDDRLARRINDYQSRLVSYITRGKFRGTYAASGPPYQIPEKGEQLYRELAQIWIRSSEQMAKLLASNEIHYYHFLQPNQYVKDSKPMSKAEREVALLESHPYREHAINGYPYLLSAGEELLKRNVPYFDLTQIFSENEEVLYVDGCCHLNQRGYDLVVEHIVDVIKSDH